MKIGIAGLWRWPHYEEAFSYGLKAQGVTVCRFNIAIEGSNYVQKIQSLIPFCSPLVWYLNRRLILQAKEHNPDWILFWRPTHIPVSYTHLTLPTIPLV